MWPGPYGEWGGRKSPSLDQSLKRMGLDYVDIFYSHRFDPETLLEETMGALDSAVRQGKAPSPPIIRAAPRRRWRSSSGSGRHASSTGRAIR
jgi:L-glyceraldehyde 3-phosphate reductase